MPGNYDGDGHADLAIFRSMEGNWYIINSGSGGTITNWGKGGDIPVPGDYDGDGQDDLTIFRPGDGSWYIRRSLMDSLLIQSWGASRR